LKAPFDAAVLSTEQDSVKFSWNQISGASSYTVQLSNDPGFASFTPYISNTGTRWFQQGELSGMTHWRIVSDNAVFSAVRTFSVIDLTALGSLVYHIHAEAGLNIVSSKVANWDNQANANYHASQAVSAARPTWKNNEINGLSTVHFGGNNGSSQHSLGISPLQILDTNFTFLILYRQESLNSVLPFILGSGAPIGGVFGGGTAVPNFGITSPTEAYHISGNTTFNWSVRTLRNDNLYLNAQSVNKTVLGGTNVPLIFNTIGLRPDAPTLNFHGDLAEIVIYNTSLSSTNRQTVENYLLSKYTPYPDLGNDIEVCAQEVSIGFSHDPAYNSIQWSTGQTGVDSVTVNTNGWYWVEVEAFDRIIRDSIFVEGLVAKPSLNVLNDTVICAGSVFNLAIQNVQPGITYTWNEGTTGTILPISGSDSFWVSADNGQDCSSTSDTLDFILDNFPLQQGLGEDRVFCLNTDLYFDYGNDGFAPYDHVWSTGSTNTFITPSNLGFETFSVVVTDALGCEAEDTVTIELVNTVGPTVNFSFDTVCPFTSNNFVNQSQLAAGDVLSNVQWNFPTNTLIGNSVNYTFPQNQPYIVELIIGTVAGCSGVKRDTVDLFPRPDIYFVSAPSCQGSSTNFNSSQYSSTFIPTWTWDFGDPASGAANIENGVVVTHNFETAGNYAVTLFGTDINGCTDTVVQTIEVKPSPAAQFEVEEACVGDFVNFTNTSIVAAPNSILSYLWQFGDGNTSGQTDPSKAYILAGTYSVTLTANGNNGCSGSTTVPVKVHAYPTPGYTTDLGCAGSPIEFEDQSSVTGGSLATISWSFDGEDPLEGYNVNWTFNETGQHTVEQTATSAFGCSTTEETIITLTDFLFGDYALVPSSIIGGYEMYFDNISIGNDTSIWIVNSNDTISSTNLNWTFPNSAVGDNVTVTLIVGNDNGCADTIIRTYPILENRTDLAITQLFVQDQNGFYTIGADLENRGSTPISSVDLLLRSNNFTVLKETWEGLLEAGQHEIYVFSAQLPASDPLTTVFENYVCVEGQIKTPVGFTDADLTNNYACYTKEGSQSAILTTYPNPTEDMFTASIVLPESIAVDIEVFDVMGRRVNVITQGTILEAGLHKFNVDATSWSSGMYTLVLKTETERKAVKLLVKP
jgi:PKD repeat protein